MVSKSTYKVEEAASWNGCKLWNVAISLRWNLPSISSTVIFKLYNSIRSGILPRPSCLFSVSIHRIFRPIIASISWDALLTHFLIIRNFNVNPTFNNVIQLGLISFAATISCSHGCSGKSSSG